MPTNRDEHLLRVNIRLSDELRQKDKEIESLMEYIKKLEGEPMTRNTRHIYSLLDILNVHIKVGLLNSSEEERSQIADALVTESELLRKYTDELKGDKK